MNRRSLLKALSALVLPGALEDPERLNWRKGAKVISFAQPYVPRTEVILKPTAEAMSGAMAIWHLKMTMKKHGLTYVSSTDIPVF